MTSTALSNNDDNIMNVDGAPSIKMEKIMLKPTSYTSPCKYCFLSSLFSSSILINASAEKNLLIIILNPAFVLS